ncbi:MAG: hypothetical protein ABJP45_06530 [Cyclobacteriaceae bacterium]
MKNLASYMTALILIIFMSSCASTRLHMKTDLYKGEIPESSISNSQMNGLVSDAISAKQVVSTYGRQKVTLARSIFELENYVDSLIIKTTLVVKKQYFDAYEHQIDSILSNTDALTQGIETLYKDYVGSKASEKQPYLLLAEIRNLQQNLNEIINPVSSGYEEGLFLTASERIAQISKMDLSPDSVDIIRNTLLNLTNAVESLTGSRGQMKRIVDNLSTDGTKLDGTLMTDFASRIRSMSFSTTSTESTGEADLAALVQAKELLESQTMRLRDLANPVWKTIASSNNWKRKFSKTKYYAEGNSSVTIVQDDPITYRVQQGSNNPAALIQGQLRVARALADATIQIVGSRVGLSDQGDTEDAEGGSDECDPPCPNPFQVQSAINDGKTQRISFYAQLTVLQNEWLSAKTGGDSAEENKKEKEILVLLETYKIKLN